MISERSPISMGVVVGSFRAEETKELFNDLSTLIAKGLKGYRRDLGRRDRQRWYVRFLRSHKAAMSKLFILRFTLFS